MHDGAASHGRAGGALSVPNVPTSPMNAALLDPIAPHLLDERTARMALDKADTTTESAVRFSGLREKRAAQIASELAESGPRGPSSPPAEHFPLPLTPAAAMAPRAADWTRATAGGSRGVSGSPSSSLRYTPLGHIAPWSSGGLGAGTNSSGAAHSDASPPVAPGPLTASRGGAPPTVPTPKRREAPGSGMVSAELARKDAVRAAREAVFAKAVADGEVDPAPEVFYSLPVNALGAAKPVVRRQPPDRSPDAKLVVYTPGPSARPMATS